MFDYVEPWLEIEPSFERRNYLQSAFYTNHLLFLCKLEAI